MLGCIDITIWGWPQNGSWIFYRVTLLCFMSLLWFIHPLLWFLSVVESLPHNVWKGIGFLSLYGTGLDNMEGGGSSWFKLTCCNRVVIGFYMRRDTTGYGWGSRRGMKLLAWAGQGKCEQGVNDDGNDEDLTMMIKSIQQRPSMIWSEVWNLALFEESKTNPKTCTAGGRIR